MMDGTHPMWEGESILLEYPIITSTRVRSVNKRQKLEYSQLSKKKVKKEILKPVDLFLSMMFGNEKERYVEGVFFTINLTAINQ